MQENNYLQKLCKNMTKSFPPLALKSAACPARKHQTVAGNRQTDFICGDMTTVFF